MSRPHRTRRVVTLLIKILVSAGLLIWLATRIDFREMGRLIAGADPGLILVAALLLLGSNILGAIQWRALLGASGLRLSLTRVFVYYFQGLFFGLFLPASVGADVSRVYDTTKHTGEFGGSMAATVMDRLVGFYSIGTMALIALAIAPGSLPPPAILLPILGFALVNLVVCLALFSSRACGLMRRVARALPWEGAGRVLVRLVDSLYGFGRKRGVLPWVFGLSLIIQVARIFVHYYVARALTISLPVRDFFVIIPVLAVLVALPISFGGIGVRESAAVQLFGHVGLSAPLAVGMQLTAFLLAIVVNLPDGSSLARQMRARTRAAPEPPATDPSQRVARWREG